MNERLLKRAVELAGQVEHALLTSADADGVPHLATVGRVRPGGPGEVLADEWFCPRTVENVRQNPRVSLVIWRPAANEGFQLLGSVEGVTELAMLDGGPTPMDRQVPQVERELRIRITDVLHFRHGPHTDAPE